MFAQFLLFRGRRRTRPHHCSITDLKVASTPEIWLPKRIIELLLLLICCHLLFPIVMIVVVVVLCFWLVFSCGRAGAAGVLVRIVVSRSLSKLWWCSDQFLTGYSRDHDWTRCDRCYPLSCGPPVDMISESRDDHPNRSTGRHAGWAGRQTGRWVGTGLAGRQAALSSLSPFYLPFSSQYGHSPTQVSASTQTHSFAGHWSLSLARDVVVC